MFAREGASLSIACMEAERKDAEAVKAEIESSEYSKGAKVNLIFCDLSIPGDSEAKRVIEEHKAAFGGKLNVLVNNAAQQVQCMDIQEMDMDTVQRTLQISACQVFRHPHVPLLTPFSLLQTLLPCLHLPSTPCR